MAHCSDNSITTLIICIYTNSNNIEIDSSSEMLSVSRSD